MKTFTRTLKTLAICGLMLFALSGKAQTCTASFQYSIAPNGLVNFWSTSIPQNTINTQFYWVFGNGNTFTATGNPFANNTYTANGSYTVSLFFMTAPTCSNMVNAVITITNVGGSPCNLNANFTSSQGSNGLVNFNNTSSGTVGGTTYSWNFGDNSTGNTTSPVHTYSANGSYTVTMTANNNFSVACVSTKTAVIVVNSYCSLVAGFNYSLNAGGNVTFYNSSAPVNSITTQYYWNFGNSATGGGANPSVTYTANGTYVVNLIVVTSAPNCTASISQTITVTSVTGCNINANFTASQGGNGLVNFNNTSTGTVIGTTYSWNFGDGGTANTTSAAHTYTANGTYLVTMTANNNFSFACTSTKTLNVVVNSICNLNASFSYTIGNNGLVNFQSTSTGTTNFSNYSWIFGSAPNGTGIAPSHQYSNGTYTVFLTVTNFSTSCIDTTSQVIVISNNTCVANANFTLVPTFTAQYWNAIPANGGNVSSAVWSWGDGSFSNTLYTSHQYSTSGTYSICLSVTVSCGASASYCSSYFVFRSSNSSDVINVNVLDPASAEVGLNENKAENAFYTVFPNPNNGEFTIKMNGSNQGNASVNLYNIIGEQVYHGEYDLSNDAAKKIGVKVSDGIYFLKVSAGDKTHIQKIVVDK